MHSSYTQKLNPHLNHRLQGISNPETINQRFLAGHGGGLLFKNIKKTARDLPDESSGHKTAGLDDRHNQLRTDPIIFA